jgi:hypothetical protein
MIATRLGDPLAAPMDFSFCVSADDSLRGAGTGAGASGGVRKAGAAARAL